MSEAILFDYHRSSASYRVRIALNLKRVAYESIKIDLAGGAQRHSEFLSRNPQGLVPMLEIDGRRIGQSLAIIDYLDATRPKPAVLPADPADRAHVLSLVLIIACDIHPLNNLRVLKYLGGPLAVPEEARSEWYRHWLQEGLAALETLATPRAGRFLFGDSLSLADICLVPQMYNARRFDVPVADYPTLVRADEEAVKIDAVAAAHPERVASGG